MSNKAMTNESKPTDAVERAVDFLEYQCGRPAALPFLDSDRFVVGEIMSRYAAAEVEQELAAYRERLRKAVETMESFSGDIIDRADVLELIGEMK
jgi:hypothetical protein